MKPIYLLVLSTVVGILSSLPVMAAPIVINQDAQAQESNVASESSEMRISVGNQTLSENDFGLEDDSTAFYFLWEKRKSFWVFGGGIGTQLYKDNERFKVRVEDQYGKESTKSSEISNVSFQVHGGLTKSFANERFRLDAILGGEYISAERRILNCTDCPKSSLNFGTPLFLEGRAGVKYLGTTLDVSYRKYLSDVIDTGMYVSIGIEL